MAAQIDISNDLIDDSMDEDMDDDFRKELSDDYFHTLRNEYDYLTSREAIIESIESNEYEFDESGSLI